MPPAGGATPWPSPRPAASSPISPAATPTAARKPGCAAGPARRPSRQPRSSTVYIEIDHPASSSDGRAVERLWTVRLRRGDRAVLIADNLGWPSANALAHELVDLLTPHAQNRGAAID